MSELCKKWCRHAIHVLGCKFRVDKLFPSLSTGSTPPPGAGPTKCTFEDVYICNYIQDLTDNFNWTRKSGSTTSSGTGPSADHTYGTAAGHYMYIEASAPARPGQLARLFTPVYPAVNQDQCLQFYYHMYGNQIGRLSVKVSGWLIKYNLQSKSIFVHFSAIWMLLLKYFI